jgi:hypothetical protein
MHRLVQDATLVWLQDHDRLEVVRERFVHCLYLSFPTGQFENWEVCRTLFPHAKSAQGQKPGSSSSLREWARVMYNAAWYALVHGEQIDTLGLATVSMEVNTQQLGAESEAALWSAELVGTICRSRGRWTEAEQLFVKVMETRKAVLGEEHPNTLTSIANLASTYWNQGRWTEAEQLFVKVMETRKAVLGEEHPDTLTSIQGRWTEAEHLVKEAAARSGNVIERPTQTRLQDSL